MLDFLRRAEEAYAERHRLYIGRVRLVSRSLIAAGVLFALVIITLILPFPWTIEVMVLGLIAATGALLRTRAGCRPEPGRVPVESDELQDTQPLPAVPPAATPESYAEQPPLYDEPRHWKFFIKKARKPLGISLLSPLVIGTVIVAGADRLTPKYLGILTLIMLGVELAAVFVAYRYWYERKHLRLIIDPPFIRLRKPENEWLMFGGGEPRILVNDIKYVEPHPRSPVELVLWRLNSRTITIDTIVDSDEAFHGMTDVRDHKRFIAIIEATLTERNQPQGVITPEMIRDGIRLYADEWQPGRATG